MFAHKLMYLVHLRLQINLCGVNTSPSSAFSTTSVGGLDEMENYENCHQLIGVVSIDEKKFKKLLMGFMKLPLCVVIFRNVTSTKKSSTFLGRIVCCQTKHTFITYNFNL